jgi:hypothetical protein
MGIGLDTSATGGVMSVPQVPGLGDDQWAAMSGMHPGHPLVGGYAGSPGFGTTRARVASIPNQPAAIASGNPSYQHWSQLFNLKNNPIGWVLILLLAYLAMHHFSGSASVSARL